MLFNRNLIGTLPYCKKRHAPISSFDIMKLEFDYKHKVNNLICKVLMNMAQFPQIDQNYMQISISRVYIYTK